ncbi:glycerol kinase GlpK [bacterium]|nr:glycerol kinase GlpK [bacterium]
MGDLILAIDQGTTGTTVLAIDPDLNIVARGYREFRQIFPKPGQVEHDPEDIWASVEGATADALAEGGIDAARIAGIGITNQRETTLVWETQSGKPYANAMVWQDRRTADRCARLREAGHEDLIRERTGLVLDPYFSGTKLQWFLDNVPGLREDAVAGRAQFGTVDSYLVRRMTGAHVTDVSNASRTLFLNLATADWDDELLGLFDVPRAMLPNVRASSEIYGTTRGLASIPDGVPVAGIAGDQQAALFGQACFSPGDAKSTYGTGAFVLVNTGGEIVHSRHQMLTTIAWRIGGQTVYALEGSCFIAGAAVQWLRDGLGVIRDSAGIEALAASVPDAGGVVFVPALTGLGAPHWNPQARGVIWGLTRGTTAAHIARAALEGIALQIADILEAMEADAGRAVSVLKVDGGASRNDLLMQMQADLADVPVSRPKNVETTAFGAAFLAGLAVGVWKSPDEVARRWKEDAHFAPSGDAAWRHERRAAWREGLKRV